MLEYEAVLTRREHLDVAGLTAADMQVILDAVASVGESVRIACLWRPLLSDPKDDMVLETAVNGAAAALVSLNRRHVQSVAARFGIELLSPAEALIRVRKGT
jgi:predicted nucleic acid-binding protein